MWSTDRSIFNQLADPCCSDGYRGSNQVLQHLLFFETCCCPSTPLSSFPGGDCGLPSSARRQAALLRGHRRCLLQPKLWRQVRCRRRVSRRAHIQALVSEVDMTLLPALLLVMQGIHLNQSNKNNNQRILFLDMLDLSANKVGGTIPSQRGSCVALDHFNFSSNRLHARAPRVCRGAATQPFLQVLDISLVAFDGRGKAMGSWVGPLDPPWVEPPLLFHSIWQTGSPLIFFSWSGSMT
jgi:hypothetical protein